MKEFPEFPYGSRTGKHQCSESFKFKISKSSSSTPQSCLGKLSTFSQVVKVSFPYSNAEGTTDLGSNSLYRTHITNSNTGSCAWTDPKMYCEVMKANSTTDPDCMVPETMYTVNDWPNQRFRVIHNQPMGYTVWVCLKCTWSHTSTQILSTGLRYVELTQTLPACYFEDLTFKDDNIDIALTVTMATASNMQVVKNLSDYAVGMCDKFTFSIQYTAVFPYDYPNASIVWINSTTGELFVDNSKWYYGDSLNKSMHTIVATFNNGTYRNKKEKSNINITIACNPPIADYSTYIDQMYFIPGNSQLGKETVLYDFASIFTPQSNTVECPITYFGYYETQASPPAFSSSSYINSNKNTFNMTETQPFQVRVDTDASPTRQYISIRAKYKTLQTYWLQPTESHLILITCAQISLSFTLNPSYEYFVDRNSTGYTDILEVTAIGDTSNSNTCPYSVWLTKDGANWNSSTDVKLDMRSGPRWFVTYNSGKRYLWTNIVIKFKMTNQTELATEAFSVRTLCPNNSVATPPVLSEYLIPSTLTNTPIEVYSIFTAFPFIHADCPYAIEIFNLDNTPLTTGGLLYTATNNTFVVLKVNPMTSSTFRDIKIRVSNLDYGYTTTSLFTVIVKCKELVFNTIAASYGWEVPQNYQTPKQLFDLLSQQPSLNSSCPLILTLLDSSDNVITANLTLGTTYPYTVQFDHNTRTSKTAKIRAQLSGIEQNTTSFIVNSWCRPLSIHSVFASGVSYQNVIRASGQGDLANLGSGIVLNTTSWSNKTVCPFTVSLRWQANNSIYNDVTPAPLLNFYTSTNYLQWNQTMIKTQSVKLQLTNWNNVVTNSGVINIDVKCAANTNNGPATSTIVNGVSINWQDILLYQYTDLFVFTSDQTICTPKLNLFQAGTLMPVAGTNVFLNSTLKNIYVKTSQVYNSVFDVVVCYTYDCASTMQIVQHTVNLSYVCANTSMAFTITTPNATEKQEAWIRAFPKPLNFTINTLTSPNMVNCKVLKIELVPSFGSSTLMAFFSPNPKDFTNFTYSVSNPYGPIVWNMTNTFTENIYLFYVKLTFVNNHVHYLQIGSTKQMNLTVYDECKQLSQTSIGILDPTPIRIILPKTSTATPLIILNITQPVRNKFLLLPQGCNVFRWEVWSNGFAQNLTSVAPDIVFPVNVDPKHIQAKTNNPMINTTFKLNALTQSLQNASIDLELKICGYEKLSLVNTSYRLFQVYKMQPTPHEITFASLQTNVSNNDSSDCPIVTNQVFDLGTTDIITDPAVTFNQTAISINLAQAKFNTFDIHFKTKGDVSRTIPFEYHVCDENTFQLMNKDGVSMILMLNDKNTAAKDVWVIEQMKGSDYGIMGLVLACIPCPNVGYYLVNEAQEPYNGTNFVQKATQIEVQTALGFKNEKVFIKVNVTGSKCTFFPSYYVPIEVSVCGFEKVTVDKVSAPYAVNVTVGIDEEPVIIPEYILNSFFTTDSPECGLDLILTDTNIGEYNLADAPWISYVTFKNTEQKTNDLVVNHLGKITYKRNTTDIMYVRAVSGGKIEAYKTIMIMYRFIPIQTPPPNVTEPVPVQKNKTEEKNQTKNETKPKEEAKPAPVIPAPTFAGLKKEVANNSTKQNQTFKAEEELKPVILAIEEITRQGKVHIVFNQELVVPPYLDTSGNTSKSSNVTSSNSTNATMANGTKTAPNETRKLAGIPLADLNVTSDIMEFKFEFKSDVELEEVDYTLEVKNWTTTFMDIQINFTDPLLISKGAYLDRVTCKVVNRDLFRGKSGVVLMSDRIYIQNDIPRQLPKGVDEDALLRNAALAGNGMKALMFTQLALQICLKGALDRLWPLFFTLQIMCYLSIYDTRIPSNAEVYMIEFTKMIEFDVLNPDSLVKMVSDDKNFKLMDFILGKKEEELAEDGTKKKSIMDDLKIYIMAGAAAFAVIFILCFCMMCYKLRARILKKLKDIKDGMMFNGTIRSITIGYIQFCISFGGQIEDLIRGVEGQTTEDRVIALTLFIFMFGYPIFCWKVVQKYKSRLDEKAIKDRISNLYQDVNITGLQTGKLMYYCIFLIRRIFFVAIPTFMFNFPFAETQFLVFFTSLYLLYYANNRPHFDKQRVLIEVFNEWMILCQCYHFMIFSEFVQNAEAQFQMGYSYVAIVGVTVAVNISLMILYFYMEYRRKKFEAKKKWWLGQNEEVIKKQLEEAKKRYQLAMYTTGVDVDLKNGFDDNNVKQYLKFVQAPGMALGAALKSKFNIRPGYTTLLDQMAKYKRKHDNDSKGRIVKTDPHTLPEYFKEPLFTLPKLGQPAIIPQKSKYASKLQVVEEHKNEDCEDDDIILDYKEMMNGLFGDFGTFAEYNRNCFLFSFDITATLPTQQQVKEIVDARELANHKKRKYEEIAKIRKMKADRAEIIDKLLQNMNNELNNNKLKTMDIKLESQKIKAANNRKVLPRDPKQEQSKLEQVLNTDTVQKALAKNPEIAATLKPPADKKLAPQDTDAKTKAKPNNNDYDRVKTDYKGKLPPYSKEREERWEEAIMKANRDHLERLPDNELNRQEKALNALLDKEYYEGKAKIAAMRDPEMEARRQKRIKDAEKRREAKLEEEKKETKRKIQEMREQIAKNKEEAKQAQLKRKQSLTKQVVNTKKKQEPKRKATTGNNSDESGGIMVFNSEDEIDEAEWLKVD